MKKFSKILTLILALVAIVTAFTVVTLATEKPAATTFSGTDNKNSLDFTFDSCTVGSIRAYNDTKRGVIFYDATVDGNKYLSPEYVYNDSETSRDGQTTDIYSTGDSSTYSLNNYPVMSFDFDVMSELGVIPTNNTSCATYFSFFVSKNGTKGPSFSRIEFANLGLAEKAPYQWRHLTFVFEYAPEDYLEDETQKHCDFKIYFYENGEKLDYEMKADFSSTAKWTAYNGDYSNVLIDCFRLACERFDGIAYSANFGFDNFTFNYFPKGEDGKCAYTIDEIGSYVYNGDYQLPATSEPAAAVRTDAEGNEYFYKTGKEAIAAAVDGDTITLLDDVDDLIVIDKAITVKTALAKSDGTLVKYKSFNFEYVTKDGYLATPDATVSSILTFAKGEDYYNVNWDPACEGECTCPAGKHYLTDSTTVALGAAPIYPERFIILEPDGRLVIEFLGWSYTKNDVAENVLDLATVTSETAGATITLYPVYNITLYDFMVISPDGEPGYYLASDFVTVASGAESGSTVKLLTDIKIESYVTVTKNLTVDLNGHNLIREYYFGNHYVATYDEATDTYTYGTDTTYKAATSSSTPLFYINAGSIRFELTSSVGGGDVYSANIKADSWYYNGELVKRDIVQRTNSYVLYCNKKSTVEISVNGGINIYAPALISFPDNNVKYHTINIDDINFYHMKSEDGAYYGQVFSLNGTTSNNITVSNSLFYLDSNSALIRNFSASNTSSTTGELLSCVTKFVNCDIIKATRGYTAGVTTSKTAEEIIFENCRLYDVGASNTKALVSNGSLSYYYTVKNDESYVMPSASGFTAMALNNQTQITYYVPNCTAYAVEDADALIQSISFSYPNTKQLDIPFNRITTKPVEVTFMNGEEVHSTATLYPGYDGNEYPELIKELEDDLYRDILLKWVDSNGKLANEVLSSDINWELDAYTFTAAESVNGVTEYIPVLKDAQYSLSYVSQFWQHFYLPVVEGMERPTITGYGVSSTGMVIINRQQYYLYTFWESASSIFNTHTLTVNYTIDGVDYSANVDISGLIYAEIILNNQDNYAAEAESVANMVRYTRENYLLAAEKDSTAAANLEKYSDRITALIGTVNADGSTTGGKYNLDAYTTDFGEVAASDIHNYSDYIYSMSFGLVGSSARTVVTLTKEASDAGVTVTINGSNPRQTSTTIKNSETGEDETVKLFYADNQRVYDAIGKISVTIVIPGESSKTVTYSMAQYITEMTEQQPDVNIDIARALYDFGVAAKAYRDSLKDY